MGYVNVCLESCFVFRGGKGRMSTGGGSKGVADDRTDQHLSFR